MDSFDRPGSMQGFLSLSIVTIILAVISLLVFGREVDGTTLLIGVGGLVIQALLIWACLRQQNWARWVMAIFFAIGLVSFLFSIGAVFQYSGFLGVVNVLSYLAGGAAVALLFTRSSSDWYQSKPAPVPRTEAEAAAVRKRVILIVGGAGAVGLAVLAAVLVPPYLRDWEPVLQTCLVGSDDPSGMSSYDACTEIIESAPIDDVKVAQAYVRRAELSLDNDRRFDALDDYWEATKADPENLAAWRGRGDLRLAMGHGHLAEDYFSEALGLSPGDPELLARRGHAYLLEDRNEEALADLLLAVEGGVSGAATMMHLGAAHSRLGDTEAALAAFDASLEIDDANPETWVLRAEALVQGGRPEEALSDYEHTIELMPTAVDAHLGIVISHCALGDLEQAHAKIDEMKDAYLLTASGWQQVMREWGYLSSEATDEDPDAALAAAIDDWMAAGCPLPVGDGDAA